MNNGLMEKLFTPSPGQTNYKISSCYLTQEGEEMLKDYLLDWGLKRINTMCELSDTYRVLINYYSNLLHLNL